MNCQNGSSTSYHAESAHNRCSRRASPTPEMRPSRCSTSAASLSLSQSITDCMSRADSRPETGRGVGRTATTAVLPIGPSDGPSGSLEGGLLERGFRCFHSVRAVQITLIAGAGFVASERRNLLPNELI